MGAIEQLKKIPINRNNMFYSMDDMKYEMMVGKNYIEQDVNQTIVLYEVDLEKTNRDYLYNEAKSNEIVFKTPKELHVLYELSEADLKTYKNKQSVGAYVKVGNIKFGIYQATLDELGCDIKRGDYIGLAITPTHMEYFTVINDGRINYDNKHTMYGTVPFYRSIVASTIDKNEFDGK